jgi:hypothetical protein
MRATGFMKSADPFGKSAGTYRCLMKRWSIYPEAVILASACSVKDVYALTYDRETTFDTFLVDDRIARKQMMLSTATSACGARNNSYVMSSEFRYGIVARPQQTGYVSA